MFLYHNSIFVDATLSAVGPVVIVVNTTTAEYSLQILDELVSTGSSSME